MALSRAAAAAARKAAQSRGLKGNRGQDGSMLTSADDMMRKLYVDTPNTWDKQKGIWVDAEQASEMGTKELVHLIDRTELALADSKKQLSSESKDFEYAMAENNRAWTDDTMETPLYNMEGDDMTLDAMEGGLDILSQEIKQLESHLAMLETELASRKTA